MKTFLLMLPLFHTLHMQETNAEAVIGGIISATQQQGWENGWANSHDDDGDDE